MFYHFKISYSTIAKMRSTNSMIPIMVWSIPVTFLNVQYKSHECFPIDVKFAYQFKMFIHFHYITRSFRYWYHSCNEAQILEVRYIMGIYTIQGPSNSLIFDFHVVHH